jgi:DNA-directed RNA polymerase specialized sigma24 family protein
MSAEHSVSHWLALLKEGDSLAAQKLWERYFHRLVGLARLKLQDSPRRAADQEDVALSAFASFCAGAEHGRFPLLDDRDDLWRLLVVVTARKASHHLRSEGQKKRGSGAVPEDVVLEEVVGREPTPEFAAQVADECRQLLGRLADADLEKVAVAKMEGYSNGEIAGRFGCAARTIERKLQLIRDIWQAKDRSGGDRSER